jgi:hypothetical protein
MISFIMEIPEIIGGNSLGFVPMDIVLEVGSRQLTKRVTAKLLLNLGDEK